MTSRLGSARASKRLRAASDSCRSALVEDRWSPVAELVRRLVEGPLLDRPLARTDVVIGLGRHLEVDLVRRLVKGALVHGPSQHPASSRGTGARGPSSAAPTGRGSPGASTRRMAASCAAARHATSASSAPVIASSEASRFPVHAHARSAPLRGRAPAFRASPPAAAARPMVKFTEISTTGGDGTHARGGAGDHRTRLGREGIQQLRLTTRRANA